MPHQDRLNIAVFIDFDNIEIGVKSTLSENFDVGAILDALKERGEVVTKIAYADWTRAGEYSRAPHPARHPPGAAQLDARRRQERRRHQPGARCARDGVHAPAHQRLRDRRRRQRLPLAGREAQTVRQEVFVVGGRAFTSIILQRNCHEFIAYENLDAASRRGRQGRAPGGARGLAPIAQAFPIVRRALKILSDREVSPQTGLLKSTLLQLDSTFSERNYGASSFLDFVEKLAQAGLAQLKHTGRSVMVELNEQFHESESSTAAAVAASGPRRPSGGARRGSRGCARGRPETEPGVVMAKPVQASRPAPSEALVVGAGDQADGVRLVGQILTAATAARWPMYLRNVKQLSRAAEGGFDERRYGFMGLIDLLRGCQSEGLVRLERDRRGGLRVFKGPALQETGPSPAIAPSQEVVEAEPLYTQPLETVDRFELEERAEEDRFNVEPMPIDTTAELLGRAKQRRPRTRVTAAAPAAARVPRKAASKKAAPRASTRSRKPARSAAPGKKDN